MPGNSSDLNRYFIKCDAANLAYEYRRPLNWDPFKEEFIDDFEANLRRGKRYRKPYEVKL